jgi:hypothetical protein
MCVCNFYLWGNFKQKVCRSSSHILEALETEIKNVILEIIMMQLSVKSTVVCMHSETFVGVHLGSPWHQTSDRSALHPGDFTAGEGAPILHWTRGWVGPKSGLYVLKKGIVSVTSWELNPQFSTMPVEVFWLLNFIVFHRVCYIGVDCGLVLWILLWAAVVVLPFTSWSSGLCLIRETNHKQVHCSTNRQ